MLETAQVAGMYACVARGNDDAALDLLFARIDALRGAGRWDVLDALLAGLGCDRLSIAVLVGLAAIAAPARPYCPSRAALMIRARCRVAVLAPERHACLWKGLA